MMNFILFSFAGLATLGLATPTLYLAGDSTMALGGGGSGTQGHSVTSIFAYEYLTDEILGFGEYLKYSFQNINIVNKAVGGRSARSYWNEGKFQAIADLVVAGDYVLLCAILHDIRLYFADAQLS